MLVRLTGVEPVRPSGHKHLKLASLPIPAQPQSAVISRPLAYYTFPGRICQRFFQVFIPGKCQGLNAEKSKIVFCALFTKAALLPQPRPPGQAPSIPARHTFRQGCRAGIHLPTAEPVGYLPRLSR